MRKYIDLTKIVKEEHPALYKKLPRFVLRLIELIIRQKAMNKIINKYIEHNGVAFTDRMVEELNLKLDIEGLENLPENGRCFFVANHLYGILDGMILANIVGNKYGRFMSITNDAFNLIPQIDEMVTSVNVYGRSAKNQIVELDKIYKSDVPINHFPAGEVSRKYNGKVEDKEWHKSFISKAISEKRDIVPIFFHGGNSKLFYSVHSLRRKLKIEANIELILLPREMFKKKNKTIKVTIGKPISYQLLESNSSHSDMARLVREHLYSLKNNPNGELILS
ncbi:MAG: glycerol acyltransferase [Chloroflexia bacterium]|nr:glycerol acyltransferase [Chloroflexia bacterium]